jgi:starch-binding outer membrane protein, SusD/RagB family
MSLSNFKTMNNKLFYIGILLLTCCTTSCKKYFEVDNSNKDTLPKTFSTIEGFRTALNGTYGKLFDYYEAEFYIYPEVAGNMTDITQTAALDVMNQQHNFVSDPDEETAAVGLIWRKILGSIANANNIIENAPGFLLINPATKNEIDGIKAQALFIRALAHFDLCRVYAQPFNFTPDASHPGVPVVISNPDPEDQIARSSVAKVYVQIVADLKEAEILFGNASSASAYYASKKAVQALLARVYLYSENWDEAIKYSSEVINNSSLAYSTDYTSMFNALIPGVETIFRLNGKARSRKLGQVYNLKDPEYMPADTLMNLFDDMADIRLGLFQSIPSTTKFVTKKWTITVPFTANEEKYDPMVLRASEMYFIRAESYLAKKQTGLCAEDLKVMIGRALGKAPVDIVINDMSEENLKRTIIKERAKEFCFEGHNFFDITRMKQNLVRGNTTSSTVKKIDYPSNLFVLPIPQSEIDANPAMTGNPTVNK